MPLNLRVCNEKLVRTEDANKYVFWKGETSSTDATFAYYVIHYFSNI